MDLDLTWTLEIQVWTVAICQGQSLAAADFRRGLNQSPGFAEDDLAYFPNGKSAIWGIYGEYVICVYIYNYIFWGPIYIYFFFWDPLSKQDKK